MSWIGVAYQLAPHSFFSLFSYRTHDHLSPGMAPPKTGQPPPPQSIISLPTTPFYAAYEGIFSTGVPSSQMTLACVQWI